jgi:redox-sensitive bicupin YhaK (pirin superfamily)
MKIVKRPATARGRTKTDWLDSRHTFSFGEYHDPAHMGFRSLRVLNDDIVEPGRGFGQHGHRDAEILSYVLEGRLEHKDSMGNGSIIEAGDVQYMSAGSGVTHSEFNPSPTERVHFLQIWLRPNQSGGAPRYAEKRIARSAGRDRLTLLFAGRPREEAIGIRADAEAYVGRLGPGGRLEHRLAAERGAWLHVIEGDVAVASQTLGPGDGVAIEQTDTIPIESADGCEFFLFDMK